MPGGVPRRELARSRAVPRLELEGIEHRVAKSPSDGQESVTILLGSPGPAGDTLEELGLVDPPVRP